MKQNHWTYELPAESGYYWVYKWGDVGPGQGVQKVLRCVYVEVFHNGQDVVAGGFRLKNDGKLTELAPLYVAWKNLTEPTPPVWPPVQKEEENNVLGYIVFTSESGCIDSTGCKLLTAEEAVEAGKAILQEYWEADQYANPEHPTYDPTFSDSIEETYADKKSDIENLCDCQLNNEDELIFMQVLAE